MAKKKTYAFKDLVKIMARLRKDCPWDRKQTHRSLLKYLKEESAEMVRAVRRNDWENLCEELGDLLLQVVFHAEMAAEKRRFTIRHVVDGLCRKLVRRHPHVFGDKKRLTAEQVITQWNEIKRRKKQNRLSLRARRAKQSPLSGTGRSPRPRQKRGASR